MEDKTLKSSPEESTAITTDAPEKLSETWAQDALQELDDWIEEQGIYIRQ